MQLPRGVALLLRLLEPRHRDLVAGDLLEEYERFVLPTRGRRGARRWLWAQAFRGSLVGFGHRVLDWTTERFDPSGGGSGGGGAHMDILRQDLKYAARRLIASPGFTLIAILSLAIGIGANTSIFTIVNAVMVRQTPMADPGSVADVYMYVEDSGMQFEPVSWPAYDALSDLSTVFEGVMGWEMFVASVQSESGSEPVMGELVSGNFFSVLGIEPVLGRGFLPEEDEVANRNPVAVISHGYWLERFSGDPGVLGRTTRLNGLPFTIVGVAPERLTGMVPGLVVDLWVPSMMLDHLDAFGSGGAGGSGTSRRQSAGSQSVFLKARLRDGISTEQAEAAMVSIANDLRVISPDDWGTAYFVAIPTLDVSIHPVADKALAPVAMLLMAVVGMLLLIACTNLASFLLARGAARKKEVALRIALGARRGRLVRQLLTETILLASFGGVLGLALAHWTIQLVLRFQPPIAIPITFDLSIDRTVLAFTIAASLGTGLLFGLLPALQSTKPELMTTLKDESRGATGGRRGGSLRNGLVMAQIAISLVLLVGSGLFVRSLISTQSVDPGFNAPEAGIIGLEMALSGYAPAEAEIALQELRARMLADPAIDEVALVTRLPLGMTVAINTFVIAGHEDPDDPDGSAVDVTTVTPEYFSLFEIPILAGRGFEAGDTEQGANVVIVNEEMSRRYWQGESPIGAQVSRGDKTFRVVGVARNTKVRTLGEAPRPQLYYPLAQRYSSMISFVATGPATAAQIVQTLDRTVRDFDRDLLIMSKKTMAEHLSVMLFVPRMAALVLGIAGGLALLLAAIGLYGVVSFSVACRTREMGIRMSLGADARTIRRLIVAGSLRLVGIGSVVGLVVAYGGARLVGRFLYGVSGTDPITFVAVPLLLASVALLAGYVPAYRASRVDPVQALRQD